MVKWSGPERRGTSRFRALCELSQEIALIEDERAIHEAVLDAAQRVLDFTNCAILLLDERGEELVIVRERGYPEETRGLRIPMNGKEGISRWVAEHGEILYVPDVREDPRYVPGVPDARSELAVPIQILERTIGVLNVESDRLDAFDSSEAQLLQALASQLALALELQRVRRELERLTYTDALTGVYNRRYLDHLLESEGARAERFDHPVGLLMIDLDDFKRVNDRYGHMKGDEVLAEFARLLRDSVRKIDDVVRFGGDEFLVVLLETDEVGAELARERITRVVREGLANSPVLPDECSIGISSGVVVRRPDEDLGKLLRQADRLMYEEKAAGETGP